MSGVVVQLTRDEMIFAAQGAVIRNIDALLQGRQAIFGDPQNELWVRNIVGTLGECAAAKYLNRYWTPVYERPTGVADIGRRSEVRSSTNPNAPLRVYERDHDAHAYLLVLVAAPKFTLVGWLWGREAKQPRFEVPKRDATDRTWCVPQSELRPVDQTRQVAA